MIANAWPATARGQTTSKIRLTARAAAGSCAAPRRLLKAAKLLPFSAAGVLLAHEEGTGREMRGTGV